MPIPMEPPAAFMAKLATGELVRYGAIIKNSSTGQIVGHLKEAGQLGELLSGLSISPLSIFNSLNPVSIIADVGDLAVNVSNSIKLSEVSSKIDELHQCMESLQLTTNVAALASVAGLGVSIGGFAALNARLSSIESKLDAMAGDIAVIKNTLTEMQLSWEAMSLAKIESAAQTLVTAENATDFARRLELAKEAASQFSQLKQYYANLLKRDGLFTDLSLDVEKIQELIVRYTLCCVGVLHAEFMIGDIGAYRSRLENIEAEYASLVSFSPKAVYQARCDKLEPLALDADFERLSASLTLLRDYTRESVARVESYGVELQYIEDNGLSFEEYQKQLRDMDIGIVMLPSGEHSTHS